MCNQNPTSQWGFHRGQAYRRIGCQRTGDLFPRSDAAAAPHWGAAHRPSDGALRAAEYLLEQRVSQYIGAMPFLWLAVGDAPSKQSHRKVIETNAIALLSGAGPEPIDPPSPDWLGRWADREAVRRSGLWNVNHVDEPYDPGFLGLLERYLP